MNLIRFVALSFLAESCILCPSPIVRPAGAGPPAGQNYVLVWKDDFDGTSLDPTRWTIRTGVRHDGINTTDAVSVAGGVLTLKTFTAADGHHTGFIDTKGTFTPLYGYLEAAIQFVGQPGMWSSFWMQSPTNDSLHTGDPRQWGTEMDIVEHRTNNGLGTFISDSIPSTVHWDGYISGVERTVTSGLRGTGLGTSYHRYGLEWTPSATNFSIDFNAPWTYSVANAPATPLDPTPPNAPVSHRTEYILLCSEVLDHDWCGTIPPGGFPSGTVMNVDYVYFYQIVVPPSGLTATAVSTSQINLAWTDNSNVEDGFSVERSTDPYNGFSQIGTTAANATTYQDTGLTGDVRYYYRVRASDGIGYSDYSNTANDVTDIISPADITGLTLTTGKMSMALHWTATGDDGNVGTATAYDLRYSTAPITVDNFASATQASTSPPHAPGWVECRLLAGLQCTPYYVAIKAKDNADNWTNISKWAGGSPITFPCTGGVASCGGGGAAEMPISTSDGSLSFSPLSPNPAHEAMGFQIQIPGNLQGTKFRVDVFDITGRQVRSLVDRTASQGQAQVEWNLLDNSGRRVASGLYIVRVDVGDTRKAFPLLVLR